MLAENAVTRVATMNPVSNAPRPHPMFASYVLLADGLVGNLAGVALYDGRLAALGRHGSLDRQPPDQWLRTLDWTGTQALPFARARAGGVDVAIPLEHSDGTLLGVFCAHQSGAAPANAGRFAEQLAGRLRPLLDCVHRDLAAAVPAHVKMQKLTERTAELEWLFKVTNNLKSSADDHGVIEELLAAAAKRLDSAVGVLCIPDKRMTIKVDAGTDASSGLKDVWLQMQRQLIAWVLNKKTPLIVNGAGRAGSLTPCKILCVPVSRESGLVIGALAFFNAPTAPDYARGHIYLARHIGRQAAHLVEAQFDLMTGLYTRAGLDQMYAGFAENSPMTEHCVIYLDIDHMHVANELHGFELGNELIVRVADLLSTVMPPEGAFAARISGDRFAMVLENCSSAHAMTLAETLRVAAGKLVIGPVTDRIDVSVSVGVADLLPLTEGLARGVAAAELACKTAKNRGGNRVERYAFEDGSMMRRHADAMAVGKLRSALKSNRLLLYAQRIAPLQDLSLPGGYEILLRLSEPDGTLVAPGPLIEAAMRYQLLPSIDRWVAQRALQTLASYRDTLRSRQLGISINVSGQSMGDETFLQQFTQSLKAACLPLQCISIELTEQATIGNLANATKIVNALGALGCRFALDDFGTGTNSLTYLKALQVSRVKIDGSFVRDLLTDVRSQATVRAIVELAKGLGIETVAEYVESHEIARALRRLGVDYAQGYAYGKPQPLAEILEGLVREESRRMHRLFLET